MDPLTVAVGGIGASVLGGILTNQSNAEQASDNRDWQERMSNTSYQRAVKDLESAGLNPMLAYARGGASTPSGAQATISNPLESVPSSAVAIANAKTQRDQVEAATAKMNVETENLQLSGRLIEAQTAESNARATDAAASAALKQSQIPEVGARIGLMDSQVKQIEAGIKEIVSRVDLNHATLPEIKARISNLIASSRLTTAQIAEIKPRIDNILSQTRLNDATKGKVIAEIPSIMNSARRVSAAATLDELLAPGYQNQANFAASALGRASPYLDQAGKVVDTAARIGQNSFLPFPKVGR